MPRTVHPFFIFCLVGLSMLTSCTGQNDKQKKTSKPKVQTEDSANVDTPQAFIDVKEVVIGGFLVGFKTRSTSTLEIPSATIKKKGQAIAEAELKNISDADMQNVTDEAYQHFTKLLNSKGYKIVDRTALLGSSQFASADQQANPYVLTQSGKVAAEDETRYFAPSSFGRIPVFLGDISGVTGGFGLSNPAVAAQKYADNTGTRVMHVSYVIDFSTPHIVSNAEKQMPMVVITPSLQIAGQAARLGIIGNKGDSFSNKMGYITIGAPVSGSTKFASAKDTTSKTAQNIQVFTNAIESLSGAAGNISREYEIDAKSQDYRASALSIIIQASQKLVDKMLALKKAKK